MQGKQLAKRIYRRVDLAALAPLGGPVVTSTRAGLGCRLQRAAVEHHLRLGCGLRPAYVRSNTRRSLHHRLKHPARSHRCICLIHRGPRWKIVRHHAPRGAGSNQPTQGVEHRTQIVLPLFAVQAAS